MSARVFRVGLFLAHIPAVLSATPLTTAEHSSAQPNMFRLSRTEHLRCVPYPFDVYGRSSFVDVWAWWSCAQERFLPGRGTQIRSVLDSRPNGNLMPGSVVETSRLVDPHNTAMRRAHWSLPEGAQAQVEQVTPPATFSRQTDGGIGRGRFDSARKPGKTHWPALAYLYLQSRKVLPCDVQRTCADPIGRIIQAYQARHHSPSAARATPSSTAPVSSPSITNHVRQAARPIQAKQSGSVRRTLTTVAPAKLKAKKRPSKECAS